MKLYHSTRLLALAAAIVLSITQFSSAQNNPLITLDETGNGSLVFPGGSPFTLTGVLLADPGPGGLSSALTYNLLGPPALVAGDLIILEPGLATVSDIIRFNPAGTGSAGYPASAVFYSDNLDGVDAIADTGFPAALYPNNYSVVEVGPEGNNGVVYTPTATQPGFIPGFTVTYHIISDVPEPTSGMFVVGALLVFAHRRRSHTHHV